MRVYHRLYTHAPDKPGATGGRFVGLADIDIQDHMPVHITEAVDELLSTMVASGSEPVYGVTRFAATAETQLCLAVAYPKLVTDGLNRPGMLSHARLIRVPRSHALLDVQALLDCVVDMPVSEIKLVEDSRRRVDAYVNQLETDVQAVHWHPASLQKYPNESLLEILSVLLAPTRAGAAPRRVVVSSERSIDAMHLVAAAWAALPVDIQVTRPWTLDVEGVAAAVAFARSGESRGEVPQNIRELASNFLDLTIGSSLDVRGLSGHGPIASVEELRVAVDDVRGAALIGSKVNPDDDHADEATEVSRVRKENTDSRTSEIDVVVIGELLRQQLTVVEERLRKHIDDRLKTHDDARQYMTPQPSDGAPPRYVPPRRSVVRYVFIAGAGALLLISGLLLGMLWTRALQSRFPVKQQQKKQTPAVTHTAAATNPAAGRGTTTASPSNLVASSASSPFDLKAIPATTWRERLRWVMENKAAVLVPLESAVNANPRAAPIRDNVVALMKKTGKPMRKRDRVRLRELFFDYIVAGELLKAGEAPVDGTVSDFPIERLRRIQESQAIESNPEKLEDFMGEVVLRRAVR